MLRLLELAALAASALAITITSPSPSGYWVQNTSNTITWTFTSSDPNPIDITITNGNETTLNGAFSIERNVDLGNGTFTVTNVTLKTGTGYVVNFVNGTNMTQIYASSQQFEVKPGGTAPSSEQSSATGTSSGSSSTSTSPTGSGNSSNNAPSQNAAVRVGDASLAVLPMLAFTGLMGVAGAVLTL